MAGAVNALPAFAMTIPFKVPAKWDRTVDVVVVGAGLTAAITAKEAGVKNVVVLEKMVFAGGNTVRAGGGFNAAIKADYEKAGIKDSPELHASQTLAAGDYRGNPEIVKKLTAQHRKAFSGSRITASNSRIAPIRATAACILVHAIPRVRAVRPISWRCATSATSWAFRLNSKPRW